MDLEKEIKEEIKEGIQEAKQQNTGLLDVLSEKLLSRKLLVWIVATGLMAADRLQSEDWVAVSLGYIGIQGVADLMAKWKRG